ncbi:dynein axonemal heavy chain 3-like [Amia ocellicauda]|uniref:dynein axonemal heavy chain 3-like n=1 Tax=Amia ocellicauda TaxID=2972642 RepID=UPI003463CA10
MNTVLLQELGRFNMLLCVVRGSLAQLGQALRGQTLLTPELEDSFNSLLLEKVPAQWIACSYPSLKPLGSFISGLLQLLCFFQRWVDDGPPTEFWLSGIFFPQSFLTGALQSHTHRHGLPIDQLAFRATMTSQESHPDTHPETQRHPPPTLMHRNTLTLRWRQSEGLKDTQSLGL